MGNLTTRHGLTHRSPVYPSDWPGQRRNRTLVWTVAVGGELCASRSLVLAVATETLVFIMVLLMQGRYWVTTSQISPIWVNGPHHTKKADFLLDLLGSWVHFYHPWQALTRDTCQGRSQAALYYYEWSTGILLLWFQITKTATCALHCVVLWKCYWNLICFDRQQISAGNWCVLKPSVCRRLKSNCEIWSVLAVSIWSLSFPATAYTSRVRPPAEPPPVLHSTLIMVYVNRVLTSVVKVLAKVQTVQICWRLTVCVNTIAKEKICKVGFILLTDPV